LRDLHSFALKDRAIAFDTRRRGHRPFRVVMAGLDESVEQSAI
jgi:hypothetical protein